ncbi:MAG: sugar kinase [Chloroflexi bacterium]|nr:sugar kinase [Chloroflexota bacterium]GIW10910.1 MAG: adenosine kinase [Dehalococcoidia bacterium]
MSILVVGSVALDTVETPFGKVHEVLGGSAVYFAAAASLFTTVKLVAIVGTDFPLAELDFLRERGVDLSGLQVAPGRTFRWSGRYDYDLNTTHTLDTQLNVFADFHPRLPAGFAAAETLFLANIDPLLQYEVRQQARCVRLTMMDTMNFWIQGQRDQLTRMIRAVDIVTMNEAELRMYAGTGSLITAARRVQELGPRVVVIKQGEYGAVMFDQQGYYTVPAYPLEEVKDPTGAGDSFAGGFLGYLDACGEVTPRTLRQAMVLGSVVASFTVSEFSLTALRDLTPARVRERYEEFRHFTLVEPI